MKQHTTRRQFIQKAGTLACGAALLAQPTSVLAQGDAMKHEKKKQVEEVSPVEDLMREHGVLERLLLIYDEIL
jgi:hypothetical protein